MTQEVLTDQFDLPSGTSSWQIDEAKEDSVVDGVNILARAVGPMFLVNGASRNKRYYSESLWEKAIKRNNDRMESGLMLGTIGHDHPLDDTALLQGMASHRVSKLWIDKKKSVGMGEILVLNTTAGRNLNAYLRGGTKFPVSSRAFGDFTGKKVGDNDEIDENSYELQTFDFVQVPGVSQAVPQLVEQHDDNQQDQNTETDPLEEDNTVGDPAMDRNTEGTQQILESLSTEKVQLQSDLDQALATNRKLESDLTIANHTAAQANEKAEKLEASVSDMTAKLQAAQDAAKAYEEAGAASDVVAQINAHKKLTAQLEELGDISSIKQVFENANKFIEANGTFEEITEKLALIVAYEELGAPDKLDKALDMLAEYRELGSVEDIQAVFDSSVKMAEEAAQEENGAEIARFAQETGVNATVAEKLLSSMEYDEAKNVAESITKNESTEEVAARYRKNEEEQAAADKKAKASQNEEGKSADEEYNDKHGTRAGRYFAESTRG